MITYDEWGIFVHPFASGNGFTGQDQEGAIPIGLTDSGGLREYAGVPDRTKGDDRLWNGGAYTTAAVEAV